MDITEAIIKKVHKPEMTDQQTRRAICDVESVCGMFRDGYDRARALEIGYHWNGIDAEMVSILDGGKTC